MTYSRDNVRICHALNFPPSQREFRAQLLDSSSILKIDKYHKKEDYYINSSLGGTL